MNKYDMVFYDFDGTLADSVPVILDCFRMAYEEVFGYCERTEENFRSYIGRPLETTFEMHSKAMAKTLTDTYLKINEAMLKADKIDLFPGVEEDLRFLKSLGIRQGIITSKREASCMTTVELKGIADIFDTFVFKEDSDRHKPDPEPIFVAAKKAGINDPARILYVGDAVPDLQCAREAGAGFALVKWSTMPGVREMMGPSDIKLEAIRDISCIISGAEL